jgi:hypothetical protein
MRVEPVALITRRRGRPALADLAAADDRLQEPVRRVAEALGGALEDAWWRGR